MAGPLYTLMRITGGPQRLTAKGIGQMPDPPVKQEQVDANVEPVDVALRGWEVTEGANGFPRVSATVWVIFTPRAGIGVVVDNVALYEGDALRAVVPLAAPEVVNEETGMRAVQLQITVGPTV